MTTSETALVPDRKAQLTEEILRLAREQDIPLRQDLALAGALTTLDVGRSLPPELFRAVAEVMVFVSKLDAK